MKKYRRISCSLKTVKVGDVLPEGFDLNLSIGNYYVKDSVVLFPEYWELVSEIPNRGDYVEGCENEDWSGKIFRGEYLGYEEKCEKYPHLMLDRNKEGITDVTVVRPAEKWEDGDVLVCLDTDNEPWMFVCRENGAYSDSYYAAINLVDAFVDSNESGVERGSNTDIRKATKEDMQQLHDMGYEVVNKKFQKIQPKIVGNNGLEGEFREEWVESEYGDAIFWLDSEEDGIGLGTVQSFSVRIGTILNAVNSTSPAFKTKKKLYLYLASLDDE